MKLDRRKFIEQLVTTYRELFPNQSDCELSENLFRLHVIAAILGVLSFFVINNKYYRLFVIFFVIFVIFTHFIFNGCILTRIEQYLCPNTRTIVDLPLELFRIQVTNKNRHRFTSFSIVIILIVFITFYYFNYIK